MGETVPTGFGGMEHAWQVKPCLAFARLSWYKLKFTLCLKYDFSTNSIDNNEGRGGWCHPWASGPRFYEKEAEQAKRGKSVSGTALWPLNQLLPPSLSSGFGFPR